MPLPLAAALIPSVIQAGTAAYQYFKKDTDNHPRATIPKEYEQRRKKIGMQEALGAKLPGQDLMENKLTASTATGIDAMKEAGNQASFGNTVAQFLQQEQDKLAEIGIAGAKRKDDLAAQSISAMKDLEGYQKDIENRDFEIDEAKKRQKYAREGAFIQNLSGAATSAASMAATYGGRGKYTTTDKV